MICITFIWYSVSLYSALASGLPTQTHNQCACNTLTGTTYGLWWHIRALDSMIIVIRLNEIGHDFSHAHDVYLHLHRHTMFKHSQQTRPALQLCSSLLRIFRLCCSYHSSRLLLQRARAFRQVSLFGRAMVEPMNETYVQPI